jgi:predicted exporter
MVVSLTLSAGGGVSLFHVLALLLVLGLAVDTAVFYLELGLDGDSWLASTLATMTSILAFGLLSLSRVPVLHYFGTVVFAGLLCSWLVTPLLFRLWGHPSPVTRQDADCD